jgi:hypothetical protein
MNNIYLFLHNNLYRIYQSVFTHIVNLIFLQVLCNLAHLPTRQHSYHGRIGVNMHACAKLKFL